MIDEAKAAKMARDARVGHVIELNAEEWFDRPDFTEWRLTNHPPTFDESSAEYCDVLIHFDGACRTKEWPPTTEDDEHFGEYSIEGFEVDFPEDIRQFLAKLAYDKGIVHGWFWLKPMSEGFDEMS